MNRTLVSRLATILTITAMALVSAHAGKPAGLAQLKAKASGTFSASASGSTFGADFTSSGPGTAVLTANSKGTTGKLVLNGSDSVNPAITYATTIQFLAKGKCKTTAIAPGVSASSGNGTWKLKGKNLTYSLSGSDAMAVYVLKATVHKAGSKLVVNAAVAVNAFVPGAPTASTYSFQ